MLILSASVQRQAMRMTEAIDAVGQALVASSLGQAVTPMRTNIPVSTRGSALFMPSLVESAGGLGVKFVSVFPGNKVIGKKTIHGVMVLADVHTSEPLALLEASCLTALRTGAAAGLATKHLARADAEVLGVIGTGAQSRSIIEAIQAVRSIKEIRLYNRTIEKAQKLAEELRREQPDLPLRVVVDDSPNRVVDASDIVVTATNSLHPIFEGSDLRPGIHFNAIGSYRPDMQELPLELFRLNPKVVVESVEAAMGETGDLIIPVQQGLFSESMIHAELGDIVRGAKPGRQTEHEITVFKSVGMASMDVVVGKMLYDKALSLGLGQHVTLE